MKIYSLRHTRAKQTLRHTAAQIDMSLSIFATPEYLAFRSKKTLAANPTKYHGFYFDLPTKHLAVLPPGRRAYFEVR